jgi:hypothetical protein
MLRSDGGAQVRADPVYDYTDGDYYCMETDDQE